VAPDDSIHEAPVNPSDLRQIANERLLDAQVLLNGSRWEFAYYASGYALECGLKSCILSRMILTGWVFEEKWDAKQCRDHDIVVINPERNPTLDNSLPQSPMTHMG
jgi:hypothetical protein